MRVAIDVAAYSALFAVVAVFALFFVHLARRKALVKVPKAIQFVDSSTTIVLPCNRGYDYTRQNSIWAAVLSQCVRKQVVFVVESESDPAYQHILCFLQAYGLKQQTARQAYDETTSVEIVVAGLSFHNSQKIHNVLTALARVEQTENIVFLDDDVYINYFTVPALVEGLKKAKVTTGYSVETPIQPKFVDDLIAVYRAINLIAFSREEVQFVWGGMFCLRWKDFVELQLGKIWTDGCYSEDMTLGNICRQLKIPILAPELCMVINPLPQGHTFRRSYCNYIYRQFYVLMTFMTARDKWVNRIAIFQIFYGGCLVWAILCYFIGDLVRTYVSEWDYQISQQITAFKVKIMVVIVSVSMLGQAINYAISALTRLTNQLEFGAQTAKHRKPALNRLRTGVAMIVHLALMPIFAAQIILNKKIAWGRSTYERENGRIEHVVKDGIHGNKTESLQRFADCVKSASMAGYVVKQRQE